MISAVVNFAGVSGSFVGELESGDDAIVQGVLHVPSTTIANGNIFLFSHQDDLSADLKLMWNITSTTPKRSQILFRPWVRFLETETRTDVIFLMDEVYFLLHNTTVWNGDYGVDMKVSSEIVEGYRLREAKFIAHGSFQQSAISRINVKLFEMIKEWCRSTLNVLSNIKKDIEIITTILEETERDLCPEDSCGVITTCSKTP